MAVLDDKGNTLSNVKLKKKTVNLTVKRQDLVDVIQSYVPSQYLYFGHVSKIKIL